LENIGKSATRLAQDQRGHEKDWDTNDEMAAACGGVSLHRRTASGGCSFITESFGP
jgi:hypothetical protein